MSGRLRIALLTHSTNPRGGVVHTLELADALTDLGCAVVVHAPDVRGEGFFRPTRAETAPFPVEPVAGSTADMVRSRVADYVAYFAEPGRAETFDVFHAQDGIGANALATLRERGLIGAFARTVHHVDRFADQALDAFQLRGLETPDRLFCVSALWRDALRAEYGREARIVGNGVDAARFGAGPDAADAALRARIGFDGAPLFVAVGGVEARKNTRAILAALRQVRELAPAARLVIAGGASLLDHDAYRAGFDADLRASGLPDRAVMVVGPLPDCEMPALYRAADALVFPSLMEGFGLVALEAMAAGTPAVVSRIAPFTEHLRETEAFWADPSKVASIAAAMVAALEPAARARVVRAGRAAVGRFTWAACAARHLADYAALAAPARRLAHV